MVTVRKADPALMDKPATRARAMSPAQLERERQAAQFRKLIAKLTGPDQVFAIKLDEDEKPITIRQRLLRAAAEANVEIAVRKNGDDGFLVGLLTPQRRTNRGRRAS